MYKLSFTNLLLFFISTGLFLIQPSTNWPLLVVCLPGLWAALHGGAIGLIIDIMKGGVNNIYLWFRR